MKVKEKEKAVKEERKKTKKNDRLCCPYGTPSTPRDVVHGIDFFLETFEFDLRDRQARSKPGSRWRGPAAHATRASLAAGTSRRVAPRRARRRNNRRRYSIDTAPFIDLQSLGKGTLLSSLPSTLRDRDGVIQECRLFSPPCLRPIENLRSIDS